MAHKADGTLDNLIQVSGYICGALVFVFLIVLHLSVFLIFGFFSPMILGLEGSLFGLFCFFFFLIWLISKPPDFGNDGPGEFLFHGGWIFFTVGCLICPCLVCPGLFAVISILGTVYFRNRIIDWRN